MSEGGSMTIQVETIKTWMVRYYKGEERAVLFDDHLAALAERDKQIAALQDEINNPKKTYCAWCGFTVEIDDEASTGIARHVDTCEKHPLNRKIAALTAKVNELREMGHRFTERIKELEGALEKILSFDYKKAGTNNMGYYATRIAKAALTAQEGI